MRRATLPLLIVALLPACAANPAPASVTAAAAPAPAVASAEAYTALRGALRWVATRQDEHYGAHRVYTVDLEALSVAPAEDVAVRVHAADENGWAAEATHAALPGRSCVYWVGRPGRLTTLRTKLEGRRGEVAGGRAICDEAARSQ